MQIAVVIPTLNEAAHLPATLASLADGRPAVVVVADCNSADGTADLARSLGAEVVAGPTLTSRAAALRAGVDHARRQRPDLDALWLLHGDTAAPPQWRQEIERTLADPAVVGGAFAQRFGFSAHRPSHLQRRLLRFVVFCNRTRYRLTGVYFGDQGLFLRPAALDAVGGVPDLPLMEDVALCRRLQTVGRLRCSRVRLTTSPRRFLRHGVLRQLLHDWYLLTAHRLGVHPRRQYEKYNADNHGHAALADG
jgi:rSAM/selenodomain-associated transferase 2